MFFIVPALYLQQLFLHCQADILNAFNAFQFRQHFRVPRGVSYHQLVRVLNLGGAEPAVLGRDQSETPAETLENSRDRVLRADMPPDAKPQKSIVRLMRPKARRIQIDRYQTQNNCADYSRHITLRACCHANGKRAENKRDIAGILDYISKTN